MKKTVRKVFLSYHPADREAVSGIADHLRESGFPVWDPEAEILPGADWTTLLKKALESSFALLAFVSPKAMESREVSREIEYALGAKHLRGRLIPVILRPAKDAPWILQSLRPVRFESVAKTSRQIVELLNQPVDV